jgi:hypothetical protein
MAGNWLSIPTKPLSTPTFQQGLDKLDPAASMSLGGEDAAGSFFKHS